jgi:predicted DNA-binding mobile mystery protein A
LFVYKYKDVSNQFVAIFVNTMTFRSTILYQYRQLVNQEAQKATQQLRIPPEGWVVTVRKALGMSGAQLGRRMGLSRSRISQLELAEPEGGVTLKTLRDVAAALGGRFVYAIVPESGTIEGVIMNRARQKAEALVRQASMHMALEKQALGEEQNRREIERIADELVRQLPADFWTD